MKIFYSEFKAAHAPNIIPDKTYMSASIRTITDETRKKVKQRVKEIIDNTCKTYGATYDLDYQLSYPAVINDKVVSELVMDSAREVLGGDTAAQGCGFANHHPKFMIMEESMINGVKTEVQTALNFLK